MMHWKWSLPIAACLVACSAPAADDDDAPAARTSAHPNAIYLKFNDIEGEQTNPPPIIETFATLTDDGALDPAVFGSDVAALTGDRDGGTFTK